DAEGATGRPGTLEGAPSVPSASSADQLLADLLVGRAPATPVGSEARWMELVALAGAEGVGPLLHRVLCSRPNVDVPAAASAELRRPRGHLVYVHAATRAVVELHGELKLLGRAQAKAVSEIWAGAGYPREAEGVAGGEIAARVMRLGHTVPLLCVHMLLQHRA